ncbi:MAG: YebC/PmpR family DNA-binding transcriptional regulator [Lentisphaeria bacterium]
MGRTFENRKAAMAKTHGAKRKLYSKYGKEIYICAKNGGVTADGNAALRRLIDRAKKDQVPSHVVEKAIEKAKGAGGEDYQPAMYEGYGPGGCVVLVSCLTDNPNRTISDVRTCFTKCSSKIGAQGSVAYQFDHISLFSFKGDDADGILEILMNADVDVTEVEEEDGMISVIAPHTEFFKVRNALTDALPNIDFEIEEITYEPQSTVVVAGDDVALFDKFIGMLDDVDDVQDVYHNAEVAR